MAVPIGAILTGASAAASLASSIFGGKDKGQEPRAGTMNPFFGALAHLAGASYGLDEDQGTYHLAPGGIGWNNALFGPNAINTMIRDLNTPPTATGMADAIVNNTESTDPIVTDFRGYLEEIDNLLGMGSDALEGFLRDGSPVSIDPIVQREQNRFTETYLPALMERLPGRTLSSSYIPSIAGRELGDIGAEIGAYEYNAREAAKARQLSALTTSLPAYTSTATARSLLPVSYANDLYNLGQTQYASTHGAQLLNILGALQSWGPQGVITRGAAPSSTSQVLDSLAKTIPSIITAWNPGGGGGNNINGAMGGNATL